MAVRNPDDGLKQPDSYNVIVGVDSLDRGLSRINLRWVVCGISVVMTLMVMLGFAFCLYSGVHHDKPRYFFLLANLILSALIAGTLLFWLWRGTLAQSVAWYVFLQCFFLFFICVTTDIFAWYAPNTTHDDNTSGGGGGGGGGGSTTSTMITPSTTMTASTSTSTTNTLLPVETPWYFSP